MIAALPLEELAEILDKKMQTGEFFKTLITAIHHPVLKVNIQLLLILCIYFRVNSCDQCIIPSHRTWWTRCKPGQNTLKCARFY
jgi:hypothetical protein